LGLKTIFTYSFPGNHLLEFSLVREKKDAYFQKSHFFFVKLCPGAKSNQNAGGRTFITDNHVTMKLSITDIFSLSFAFRSIMNNQVQPFSLCTDTAKSSAQESREAGGFKSLMLKTSKNEKAGGSVVNLYISKKNLAKKDEARPFCYMTSPFTAFSIAQVLNFMGQKALELEYDYAQKRGFQTFKQSHAEIGHQESPRSLPVQADRIDQFVGPYFFLSNNHVSPIIYDGVTFKCVSTYYHAMKSRDRSVRESFALLSSSDAERQVKSIQVRDDWEDIRSKVMEHGLKLKFQNPELREKLEATRGKRIVFGHRSDRLSDLFWGFNLNTGEGENHLGNLLMKVRGSF
jgi:ribA/ribD-fused uncharacterized protein